ncbi:hypothetical protein [Formosa sp. PL04]|uniref:hypothetical protein n=1 Tax=Formosa sp. PL04 TaxID=3081755 RepID=UPI002980C47E|nr:hypothetical protein [Formosa sp. PL04]MDW5288239.1 hypothetical protein [Formosa sp. PL04]
MKKIGFIFTLLGFISILNCTNAKDKLSFIYNLEQSIASEYNTDQIEIKVNEDEGNIDMLIIITDPKFNNYSEKQKHNMAKIIGEFALKSEKETSKTKTGELLFKNETNMLLYKTTDSEHYKMY